MIKRVFFISFLLSSTIAANAQLKNSTNRFIKNKLKFSVNYAFDYAVNAFIVGADFTKKKGYLYQLEYYRNLHKRFSVGISAGYANGIDRNNPQLDTLDYEITKYIHLGVQGFIVNNLKNRLYLKLSTGLTHTDRLNSTVRTSPWFEERGLQYSNHGGFSGFTAEISYDRQFYKNLFGSINLGFFSHNDGANYAGCAVGYAF